MIYPGQKQIVQTVMSGLEQGDGVVIVTPPGTGKSNTLGRPIIKEFLSNNPEASVLVISKNRSLLKKRRESRPTLRLRLWILDAPEGEPGSTAQALWG